MIIATGFNSIFMDYFNDITFYLYVFIGDRKVVL